MLMQPQTRPAIKNLGGNYRKSRKNIRSKTILETNKRTKLVYYDQSYRRMRILGQ